MSELIEIWQEAKQARINAQEWNALPDGPKYGENPNIFAMSVGHCSAPILTRSGQKECGGNSYWETDKQFNRAILEYIIDDWADIYPQVIKRMYQAEEAALLECQTYVDELQNKINEVKK